MSTQQKKTIKYSEPSAYFPKSMRPKPPAKKKPKTTTKGK